MDGEIPHDRIEPLLECCYGVCLLFLLTEDEWCILLDDPSLDCIDLVECYDEWRLVLPQDLY